MSLFAYSWKREKSSAKDGEEGVTASSREENRVLSITSSSVPPSYSSMMSCGGSIALDAAAEGGISQGLLDKI